MLSIGFTKRFAVGALVLGLVVGRTVVGQVSANHGQGPQKTDQVDALFSRFTNSTPGCSLAVTSAGDILYARAYGTANLELGVPLKVDSVFGIDSMSKQFTGMAIALLAAQGKLSFRDDVHKYIPELPNFGHRITIENLLHHTSGIKDANELLKFSGFRPPFDIQTKQMYLDIILRQRELNFLPGDEFVYSDSNYFLLGLVVERVSGKPLAAFARQELFEPLGMTHTEFREDASSILKGRASGYNKAYEGTKPDGMFHDADAHIEALGEDGVFTTVEDLAKWDRNFYDAKVGGPKVIDLMLEQKNLNDGTLNRYLIGLFRFSYRGLTMIAHGGGGFGTLSDFIRFPDQRLSVVVLCNVRDDDSPDQDITPDVLSRKIADIYLAGQFKDVSAGPPPPGGSRATVELPASSLARFEGLYWDGKTEFVRRFDVTKGNLSVRNWYDTVVSPTESTSTAMEYVGGGEFRADSVVYRFTEDQKEVVRSVPSRPDNQATKLKRVLDVQSGPREFEQLTGLFYSNDVDSIWRIAVKQDQLVLERKSFPDEVLLPAFRDAFYYRGRGVLHFVRDKERGVQGFEVLNNRLRRIWFVKRG